MKKIVIFMVLLVLVSLASCKGEEPVVTENSSVNSENSSVVSYPIYEVTSPIYTDLTLEHFKKLYVGMPFEEAIKIVGAPHETEKYDNGQEISIEHYYTALNGRNYSVVYKNGMIAFVKYPTYYDNLPKKTNLKMEDINKLYIGMPFEEAIEILGEPHGTIGFGRIHDTYKLIDGKEWAVHYKYGIIDEFYEYSVENS